MELLSRWVTARGHLFDVCSDVNDENTPGAGLRLAATRSARQISMEELILYATELLTLAEYNVMFAVLCMIKIEGDDGASTGTQAPANVGSLPMVRRRLCNVKSRSESSMRSDSELTIPSRHSDTRAARDDYEEDKRAKKIVLRSLLHPHVSPAQLSHITRMLLIRSSHGPPRTIICPIANFNRRCPSLYRLMQRRLLPSVEASWCALQLARNQPRQMRLPRKPSNLIRDTGDAQSGSAPSQHRSDPKPPDNPIHQLFGLENQFSSKFLDLVGVYQGRCPGSICQERFTTFSELVSQSMESLLSGVDRQWLNKLAEERQVHRFSDAEILGSIHRMTCFVTLLTESTHQQLREMKLNNLVWAVSSSEDSSLYSQSDLGSSEEEDTDNQNLAFPLYWYVDYALSFLYYLVSPDLFPISIEREPPAGRWQAAYEVYRGALSVCAILQNFYHQSKRAPNARIYVQLNESATTHITPELSECSVDVGDSPGTDTTNDASIATLASGLGNVARASSSESTGESRSLMISAGMARSVTRAARLLESHHREFSRKPVNRDLLLKHVEEFLDLPYARTVDFDIDWNDFATDCIGPLAVFSPLESGDSDDGSQDTVSAYSRWRASMFRRLTDNFSETLCDYYEGLYIHGFPRSTILQTAEICQSASHPQTSAANLVEKLANSSAADVRVDPMLILPFIATDVMINIKRCTRKMFRWVYGDGAANIWLQRRLRACCHIIEMIEDCEHARVVTIPPMYACPWLNYTTDLLVNAAAGYDWPVDAHQSESLRRRYNADNVVARIKVSLILIDLLNSHLMEGVSSTARKIQDSLIPFPLTYYESEVLDVFGIDYDRLSGKLRLLDLITLTPPAEAAHEEVCVSIVCRWLDAIADEFKNFISWNFLGNRILIKPTEIAPTGQDMRLHY